MALNGWKLNAGQTELQAQFGGAERIALDATGLSFHGAAPAAQSAHITNVSSTDSGTGGDDATFVTAINAIIAVLEAHGLTATS